MNRIFYLLFILPLFTITANGSSLDSLNSVAHQLIVDNNLDDLHSLCLKYASEYPDFVEKKARVLIKNAAKEEINYKGFGYFDLGEAYFYKEMYDNALTNYNKSTSFFNLTKNQEMLSSSYSNIGLIYLYKAKYAQSIEYYEKSLALEKQLGNKTAMAKCYQNIGIIFGNWGKDELQLRYYKKALDIFYELNEEDLIADMSLNLGVANARQERYTEAQEYYQQALDYYQQHNDSSRLASIYTNIGFLNMYQEKYDSSNQYFSDALTIFNQLNDKTGAIYACQGLGDLYAEQGLKQMAIEKYLQCENINTDVGLLSVQASNLESLYKAYKAIEDYPNAIRILEKYHSVRDSIYNQENAQKILELDTKYQHQKNLNELSQLKSSNKLYLVIVIVSFSLSVLGGTLLFFLIRYRRLKNEKIRLNLEQKVLRTQMNPHFIFNSLSAIQCYILENKVEDAIDFLADFAGLIRMVLDYSKFEYITVKQERDLLEYYIKLQSRRFGGKITYSVDIDDKIEAANTLIPPMLSQPFIENSFEHGELNKMENGKITVSFSKCKNNCVCLIIDDNGIGIDNKGEKRKGGHKSLATSITKERLKTINKSIPHFKLSLSVDDKSKFGEQGTRVKFKVPLITKTSV